jgi:hypothetical protein
VVEVVIVVGNRCYLDFSSDVHAFSSELLVQITCSIDFRADVHVFSNRCHLDLSSDVHAFSSELLVQITCSDNFLCILSATITTVAFFDQLREGN